MANYIISSTVKATLEDLSARAAQVYTSSERSWKPILSEFRGVVSEMGVMDRKSDGGKAIDAIMGPAVLAALVKGTAYDVHVHRVGAEDEYLPVDAEHPANYTITGAFAVGADLTELPSVKDRPRGLKAWLRGNAENGLRPDGEKGSRDVINNAKDQVLSRFWKKTRKGGGEGPAALDSKLLGLYKHLKGARDRWETDGGECVSDAEMKTILDETADRILKRKAKARKS